MSSSEREKKASWLTELTEMTVFTSAGRRKRNNTVDPTTNKQTPKKAKKEQEQKQTSKILMTYIYI